MKKLKLCSKDYLLDESKYLEPTMQQTETKKGKI